MDEHLVHILLIDDDEDDFLLTRERLADIEGVAFRLDWVATYDAALQTMTEGCHDVYLVDFHLGGHSGLELLCQAQAMGSRAPVIMLTGQGDRSIDVEAMKAGAADYLVKGEIDARMLERSIRYALERHRNEEKLTQLANYDSLTGLPNRGWLQDQLRQMLSLAERTGRQGGVLFLDLDRFKVVNDTLGHSAGDLLLQGVAGRLRDCLRNSDTLARLGGDEFVALLPDAGDAAKVKTVAHKMLDALAAPFAICGETIFSAPSIGAALFPSDGQDVETLLKHADVAMYRAKEAGGNTLRFYAAEMNSQAVEQFNLESRLRQALERKEFHVRYQPRFDLDSGVLVGAEACLCWQPEADELVCAAQFATLLEETGIVVPVQEWALQQACRQARLWRDQGWNEAQIFVPVSGRQLQMTDLLTQVSAALVTAGLPPSALGLEFSEDTVARQTALAREVFPRLVALGVGVHLGDFGDGRSSLRVLKNLPVARLKLGPAFLPEVADGQGGRQLTEGVLALARALELKVVAVGIERESQRRQLRQLGCAEGQGHFFGAPVTGEDFSAYFSA